MFIADSASEIFGGGDSEISVEKIKYRTRSTPR